jgi:hypothetical protein
LKGFNNGFVTKLNPTGTALVYSTYLGGTEADTIWGIALDATNNAYVTGETFSGTGTPGPGDFPTVPLDPSNPLLGGALSKAFVTKVDPAGAALVYSVLLGGTVAPIDVDPTAPPGSTAGTGSIAVDKATGVAYVAGNTNCTDFPTTAAPFRLPWDI